MQAPSTSTKSSIVRRRALCADDPAVSVKIRGIRALALVRARVRDQAVVKIRLLPPDRRSRSALRHWKRWENPRIRLDGLEPRSDAKPPKRCARSFVFQVM